MKAESRKGKDFNHTYTKCQSKSIALKIFPERLDLTAKPMAEENLLSPYFCVSQIDASLVAIRKQLMLLVDVRAYYRW